MCPTSAVGLLINQRKKQMDSDGVNPTWMAKLFWYNHVSNWLPAAGFAVKVRVRYSTLHVISMCPSISVRIPLVSIGYIESVGAKRLYVRGIRFRLVLGGFNQTELHCVRNWLRFMVVRQRIPHSILGLPLDWEVHRERNTEPLRRTWETFWSKNKL